MALNEKNHGSNFLAPTSFKLNEKLNQSQVLRVLNFFRVRRGCLVTKVLVASAICRSSLTPKRRKFNNELKVGPNRKVK